MVDSDTTGRKSDRGAAEVLVSETDNGRKTLGAGAPGAVGTSEYGKIQQLIKGLELLRNAFLLTRLGTRCDIPSPDDSADLSICLVV